VDDGLGVHVLLLDQDLGMRTLVMVRPKFRVASAAARSLIRACSRRRRPRRGAAGALPQASGGLGLIRLAGSSLWPRR
ncbi:hypothetical protein RZS08_23640, partial [Arthrospira platensis SPKY1]|nr:hypothetical protein [Arthrospira platensis SPKY1]